MANFWQMLAKVWQFATVLAIYGNNTLLPDWQT